MDKRTDIWAFGCVLYELLTGKPAFHGEDITDILAAVVRAEPDWQALPAATPVKIRDLLRRCLQKDKTLRLRDAGDARIEIHEAQIAPATLQPTSTTQIWPGVISRRAVVGVVVVLIAALVGGFAVWNLKPAPAVARPVTRTVITLPPGQQLASLDNGPAIALSPDSTHLAYAAIQGGTQQLYLRAMDSLEARPVPGTEGGFGPFFSPDDQWIGFFADGKLKKISVQGGAAVTLCDAAPPVPVGGASWGEATEQSCSHPSMRLPLSAKFPWHGGTPQPLTTLDKEAGEITQRWPQVLPGSKAVLFTSSTNATNYEDADIVAVTRWLPDSERRCNAAASMAATARADTLSMCTKARCSPCPST